MFADKMVLDFHTHAWPDKIARAALALMAGRSDLTPLTDGTYAHTEQMLRSWGVDHAIVLPVATKASQHQTINEFAASINAQNPFFTSFGSVHPLSPDVFEALQTVLDLGLRGIKLHPEYQQFFIDDERVFPVYEWCRDHHLIVIAHTGADVGYPPPYHSDPQRIAYVLDAVPGLTFVAAHLGSYQNCKGAKKYLVGRDIYFDTAFIAGYDPAEVKEIVLEHGADHILFGSDCPWMSAEKGLSFLHQLELGNEAEEKIFAGNALKILG